LDDDTDTSSVELATELTIAWLSNPNTKAEAGVIGGVLRQIHEAVKGLSSPTEPEAAPAEEFTLSVRKSLASKDHILSLIEGKPYRSLPQVAEGRKKQANRAAIDRRSRSAVQARGP
jgi:predicted transcriptional regulator